MTPRKPRPVTISVSVSVSLGGLSSSLFYFIIQIRFILSSQVWLCFFPHFQSQDLMCALITVPGLLPHPPSLPWCCGMSLWCFVFTGASRTDRNEDTIRASLSIVGTRFKPVFFYDKAGAYLSSGLSVLLAGENGLP